MENMQNQLPIKVDVKTGSIRPEGIIKAIAFVKFYCGYLTSQKAENYLLQTLSSVLIGTVHDSENRIARMDFKIAVELSKPAHVIAYSHNIDETALHKLHLKCLDEVKQINARWILKARINTRNGKSKKEN